MSILMTIGLALALSIDAFAIAAGCSAGKKIPVTQGALLALCFSIFHALFLIGGYLIGQALGGETQYYKWIAVAIIAFVGVKLILRAVRKPKDDNTTYVTGSKTILLLALATSFDFMLTGLGLGMLQIGPRFWWCAGFLAFFTMVSTFFGVLIGRQNQKKSRRWATFLQGALLVAAAVHFFLKLLIL